MLCSTKKLKVAIPSPQAENESVVNSVSKAVQNHLVVEKIASFLSVTDLKNFRLVNRQWNRDSLSIIRKKVYCYRLHNPFYPVQRFTTAEMKSVLNLFSNSINGFPCVDFRLATNLAESDEGLFYKILKALSSFVVELDLYVNHEKVALLIPENITFPNLKTLQIDHFICDSTRTTETFKCFLFISQNAVLENLSLKIMDNTSRLLQYINAIESGPCVKNLKALSLYGNIKNDHLSTLARIGLKLKELNFSFPANADFTPENFRDLLKTQSSTLEKLVLKLNLLVSGETAIPMFPQMRKLKKLSLKLPHTNVKELCLHTQFPVLKHLEIGAYFSPTSEHDMALWNSAKPMPTVESLVLPVHIDDFEIVDLLSRIFPMLKKLEIHGPDKICRPVGKEMEHLVELSLITYESIRDDETINALNQWLTGYTTDEIEDIQKVWKESGMLQSMKERKPNPIFQNIRVLRFIETNFTDVRCLLGPMKLTCLQCLDLRKSLDSEISQDVVEQMRKKFTVLIADSCIYDT